MTACYQVIAQLTKGFLYSTSVRSGEKEGCIRTNTLCLPHRAKTRPLDRSRERTATVKTTKSRVKQEDVNSDQIGFWVTQNVPTCICFSWMMFSCCGGEGTHGSEWSLIFTWIWSHKHFELEFGRIFSRTGNPLNSLGQVKNLSRATWLICRPNWQLLQSCEYRSCLLKWRKIQITKTNFIPKRFQIKTTIWQQLYHKFYCFCLHHN